MWLTTREAMACADRVSPPSRALPARQGTGATAMTATDGHGCAAIGGACAQSALALPRPDPLGSPAGTLLLLWPTLSALWIAAGGFPGWHLLVVFVLGTFLMRSAGCAANDVADREFDRHVKRTANRPVTSGAIGVARSAALGAALALVAFALVLTTNLAAVAWSVAALAVTLVLSVQQALLRDAAGGPRRRLQLRHSDGVRGGARRRFVVARVARRRGAGARVVAAARQPVLGPRLRHRVRDGRPRRRPPDRHPHLGDHARPLRRRRGDGVLRRVPRDLGGHRRAPRLRLAVLRRPGRRRG